MSDSDSSHSGGFRTFRQISRDRLLQEMLHAARKGKGSAEWKVLIMDEVTVKVMSCSCKMADITDEGISCKHCFSGIYIACSCCNEKTINDLIVSSGNRVFCPSVLKEDVMRTCAVNG
jgi:hypothetical protein